MRTLCMLVVVLTRASATHAADGPVTIRVATFNVEDVRTRDLLDPAHPRLRRLAEVIQRIRPNVILLNEIAFDIPASDGGPAVPGLGPDAPGGRNGRRFAESFLAVAQATDVEAMRFKDFMAPVNTGMPSGFDLDRDGTTALTYPLPEPTDADGRPPAQTAEGRAFGGDCFGFGTFPGQYGMTLLVDERLDILSDEIRTFRLLPWDYMPGAMLPPGPDGTGHWYTDEQKKVVRLSSKSHWDVPVRLPNGAVVHFLCSHPTPPVFDGPEKRNARRNRDEIRFWADYVDEGHWIVDDANRAGGLEPGASFIILGDLNADPTKGQSLKDPIGTILFSSRRVNGTVVPEADVAIDGLDAADTAAFKLRVDYVLPSRDLGIKAAGTWRMLPAGANAFPSDHFPVWMDVVAPGRSGGK